MQVMEEIGSGKTNLLLSAQFKAIEDIIQQDVVDDKHLQIPSRVVEELWVEAK